MIHSACVYVLNKPMLCIKYDLRIAIGTRTTKYSSPVFCILEANRTLEIRSNKKRSLDARWAVRGAVQFLHAHSVDS